MIGPNGARSGRTGWNGAWTFTRTQSPGRHVPVTVAPAMSTQA